MPDDGEEDVEILAKPEAPSTEVVEVHDRHLVVRRFRLAVIDGPDADRSFASSAARQVIGTHPSADFVLADRAVSRFHAELAVVGGRVRFRDLGSRNGSTVDGVEMTEGVLRDGAVLELGRTKLRLQLGSDCARVPLGERVSFGRLVGGSAVMRALFALLEKAAASDANVLIEGETGSGKDAAAESIHSESARREGPFIVVDCGAIPDALLESELFGHERGAFTGAVSAREGAFEAARGGTIMLDEIGELPLELQPKLLRVLEKKEIKRVGRNVYTPVDVRVIAATNRSLRTEVNHKRFRSDLYYRLAVIELSMPPLRDRRDDLPGLVEKILGEADAPIPEFIREPPFLRRLAQHPWPGNVRELRNYVQRCVALSEQRPLATDVTAELPDLAAMIDPSIPLKQARELWSQVLEKQYLDRVLELSSGNVSAAARQAGMDRIHFYRLLWKHGLK